MLVWFRRVSESRIQGQGGYLGDMRREEAEETEKEGVQWRVYCQMDFHLSHWATALLGNLGACVECASELSHPRPRKLGCLSSNSHVPLAQGYSLAYKFPSTSGLSHVLWPKESSLVDSCMYVAGCHWYALGQWALRGCEGVGTHCCCSAPWTVCGLDSLTGLWPTSFVVCYVVG